jgi:hypothetical protein
MSFLRRQQLHRWSRNSQPFTEHESSLFCSQEPATDPYSEPDESSPHLHTFFKINFNIIFPSVPLFQKFSLAFRFLNQNFVLISHPFHACYMPNPIIFGEEYKL